MDFRLSVSVLQLKQKTRRFEQRYIIRIGFILPAVKKIGSAQFSTISRPLCTDFCNTIKQLQLCGNYFCFQPLR
jgi:hypothetical protein